MTSSNEESHEHKGWGAGRWIIAACAGCALAGGVIGGVIANSLNSPSSSSPSASPSATVTGVPQSSTGKTTQSSCQVTTVAENVLPSVVTISATGASGAGTGSGEIIKSDGYILTNNHVVATAAGAGGSLGVLFSDGKSAPATLVGRDPLTDVAVIKVDETGLPAIPVGNSSSLVIGEPVVVLGAPLGLSSTVTSGIVSALDRTIQVPGENSQSALLIGAIQTDAAINPGNSGGAMVNCNGQFVGVPSAGATVPSENGQSSGGSIGLGFAIPGDFALQLADQIISTGHVTHAYFGIQAVPVSAEAAKVNGIAEGLLVQGVDSGGPAAAAGLAVGDVITEISGQPAVSTDQLAELTITQKPGDKVTLGYSRNGAARTTTVTLGAQPAP
jgi:putative serine protease PepD